MDKIVLEEIIKIKKREFIDLKEELKFLETINFPIYILKDYDANNYLNLNNKEHKKNIPTIYSYDYSLATHVKLEKRSEEISSHIDPYDGAIYSRRVEVYPRFYFLLKYNSKTKQVLIEHSGFDKDKNIIIRSCDVTTGTGDYTRRSEKIENYIDTNKVISFFEKIGVKRNLLKTLEEKIKTHYEAAI